MCVCVCVILSSYILLRSIKKNILIKFFKSAIRRLFTTSAKLLKLENIRPCEMIQFLLCCQCWQLFYIFHWITNKIVRLSQFSLPFVLCCLCVRACVSLCVRGRICWGVFICVDFNCFLFPVIQLFAMFCSACK